jgi:hypothetical protein
VFAGRLHNLGKIGYRSNTVPATLNGADNILVVGDSKHIAYKEADDEIVSDNLKARRISVTEYQGAISKQ